MKLVFSDDFTGPAGSFPDPAKWGRGDGLYSVGSHELGYYTPRFQNVSLDGLGHLRLNARREVYGTGADQRAYTSGWVGTDDGRFSMQYGSAQARIKIPAGRGLWPAFWMIPLKWSYDEIDVLEVLGHEPSKVYGTMHGGPPPGWWLQGSQVNTDSLAAAYHVYGVDWTAKCMHWTLDGVPYASVNRVDLPPEKPWGLDQPFYLVLNLAVGGDWPGPPDASTVFPARMLVDWVKVYQ